MATTTSTETSSEQSSFMLQHVNDKEPMDVEVDIHYYKDPGDGTIAIREDLASNNPKFCDTRRMLIRDVRGKEENFTLETNGFQYFKHPASERSILEDDKIKDLYYPQMEQAIKELTGAKTALIYNHIIREKPWEVAKNPSGKAPASRPHVDLARSWAPNIVKNSYGDEAQDILSKHWQLVNLWRPLKTVQKNPLAVIDAKTIPASDQFVLQLTQGEGPAKYTTDNIFTMATHAENHQWYYLGEQRPDEVLALTIFDSDDDAKAPGTAHTSFNDPRMEHMPTRESIEIRLILSY